VSLATRDRKFGHDGITRINFHQLDMDRVMTAFLARLWHAGYPSRIARGTELTVDDFVASFLERPEFFTDFDPDVAYRWVETHLMDMVNRGKPTQAVAGPRPLHGFTYRFRNSRRSRPYGGDEQLYEMLWHARDSKGRAALEHLKDFFFTGIDQAIQDLSGAADTDVETQALLRLADRYKQDSADTGKARSKQPPLCIGSADLLADDVLRLLYHRNHIPRSVMVDYLKILFSFHLGLYHLRLLKLLPALVAAGGAEPTCALHRCPVGAGSQWSACPYRVGIFLDVIGVPGTPVARLAEHSAEVWYRKIPGFIRAAYTITKLAELATVLEKTRKITKPAHGFFGIPDVLALTAPNRKADREAFFKTRMTGILDSTAGAQVPPEIAGILDLGLDDATAYIEILTAYRGDYHRKYIVDCLDSLLLKRRPGALLAQPGGQRSARRFVLDSRLLEVLLQINLLTPGPSGQFHTAPLRVDQFLTILRDRYGLFIDRLPTADGFASTGITDHAALRHNATAFTNRLREIGFYQDLSDAYVTQTITPRYTIDAAGPPAPAPAGTAGDEQARSTR
jgi:hypothetical protein